MLSQPQSRLLTTLGALAVLLVLANATLFMQNRGRQATLGERQQFVQQTVPLESLYRDIVRSLADAAVKSNDRQVLDMLAAQGLSVSRGDGSAAGTGAR
jgi:hypothetical protein